MVSQFKTNVRTVFGILEMLLCSGVVFGWANMVLILKEEEYFKDLCADESNANSSLPEKSNDDSEKCGKQDERLALIFTLSVFAFNVAGFIGGALLDKFGTRFVRLIACFFYILTGVLAFFMEKDTANLMFPLAMCLAFAGMLIAITDFQIAVLHPKHRFIVSSSLSGALDSSSVVFLIFKVIYDAGVPIRWALVGYVVLALVWTTSSTFFLLPKTSIAAEQEEFDEEVQVNNKAVTTVTGRDQEMGRFGEVREFDDISKQQALELTQKQEGNSTKEKSTEELGMSNQAVTPDIAGDQKRTGDTKELSSPGEKSSLELGISNQGLTPDTEGDQERTARENGNSKENGSMPELQAETQKVDKYSSGWRYILTARFLWHLYLFSFVQLRLWFFVGSLNSYLVYYSNDDKSQIERYSEIFGLVQFFGFFIAPFTGIVMNLQPRNISNEFFGPMMSFIITLLLCFILGILVLIPALEVQYFAFVVQVTMRAFLYASLISFVLRAFPVEHYGKLYGVCTTTGAVISLLQYPAIVLIDGPSNGDPYWVNFGFLIATFTAMGLPLYLWLTNRNVEEVTSF